MTATNESLATAFQRCRQSFEAVLTLCIDIENSSRDAWEDEASRLRLWGANIGAAQTKSSTSLDFRLRDADTVRLQIHKNLSNLDEALNEAVVCLGELAQPYTFDRNAKPSEESMQSQTSSKTLSHREGASVESQEHDDSSASDNGASVEDLQAAFDDVVSLINSLFRMTLYIQNPSRRDQLKHRDTSAVANFETFDVSHVENKFPKAVGSLTQRLGQANTVRRANLKYWERHHKKLAFDESVNDAATIAPLSESVATAFQPVQVEEDQTDTRSHFSGTSYMESLLGGESIRRPDLPEEGRKGTPFQCPICCYIVTVFGQREWMKHVFFDLQPYVCVFEDCKKPLLLYENRRDWFSHVTNNHIPRDASNPLLQHLQCPLCRDSIRSLPSIRRHLARHLEEVALFSLPNSLFGEETEMVDDDKPADYSSEEEAITEDVVSKREGLSGLQMWERVDVSHDDLDKVAIDSLLGESSSRGLDRPRVEEQPEERRVSPDPQEMHRPRKDGNGNHSPVSSSDDEFVVVEEGGSTMFSQESDEGPLKGGPDDAYGKEAGLSLSRPGDESETRIRSSRPRDLKEDLWTEITKDLVEEEAIRQMGYDFEETDHFYYILQYLQYGDVSHLVDLSEDIRIGRRRRSKAVGWEDRIEAPHRLLSNEGILGHSHHDSGWDPNDERYIEREIVYRGSNHINPTDETIRKPRQNEPTEISSADAREEVQKLVAIPPEPREALESLSSQKQLLEQDMKAGIDRHEDVERSDASMRAQSGRVPGTEDDRDDNKSRTSSPQGLPMLDTLEEHGDDRGLTVPRATSRPVPATMHTGNSQPGRGDSPRSRRRKILSVELTHPLRENLLRERGTTDRAEVDTEAARDKPRPEQRRRMGAIPREEAQQVGSDASEPETTEEKEEIIIRRVDSEYRPIPHLRDTSREREEVLIRKLDDGSDWAPSPRDERAREEIIIRRGERPDDEYPSGRTNMRKDGYEHDKESTVEQRRESLENYYEAHKMPEQTEKGRIIWEAGGAEEKRKKENEDPKQKRLEVEQEEKERKRKKQTELEDRLFEEKVREKFKLRGYSDAHIDEVLHRRKRGQSQSDREWAIDLSRPTFIKINRKYLLTETLDHFQLPWEWDKRDDQYIVIKKYISKEFQEELFAHTKTLCKEKSVPNEYEKNVTVPSRPTKTPAKDDMYVVRRRSKSPSGKSRSRRMFT